MYGEHDPTHDRRTGTPRRGRRPYGEPAERAPGSVGRHPAPPPAPASDPAYGTADDPFAYGSWINVEVRPPGPPPRHPAPEPPQWSWPEMPRDRLLRSALILGFLAAAGVGVWTSGWTPMSGPSGVGAAAPATPSRTDDRDGTPPPATGGPVAASTVPPAPSEKAVPSEKPAHNPAARPSPAPERPRTRSATAPHRGRDDQRHAGRGTPDAVPETMPERVRRPGAEGAGSSPSRRPETAEPRSRVSRGGGGARRNAGSGRPGRTERPRPVPVPRGRADGADRDPAPEAQEERNTGGAGPSTTAGGGGTPPGTGSAVTLDERLSATYACRHLRPDDWRYAYCVTAWNEYRKRIGLP
ncbi:hypothetical protein [Streptosporangium sp. NPDC004631]